MNIVRSLQTTENLRYLLWRQKRLPRAEWAEQLSSWAGCSVSRALALIDGTAMLQVDEQNRIVKAHAEDYPISAEDLQFERMVEKEDILNQNILHLLESLEHGEQTELAHRIGLGRVTISRWRSGSHRPNSDSLAMLVKEFGLGKDINLKSDPIFLSMAPISYRQRRKWLHDRIDRLPQETINELFPAFERLLREGS